MPWSGQNGGKGFGQPCGTIRPGSTRQFRGTACRFCGQPYIYLALGDRDQTFKHLERDLDLRDPELPYINADPVFDPVRNEPRFAAILKKMGLSK